jgi:hypothetical protein
MPNAYPPPSNFFRTPEQKKDMFLSWARDDISFFGGGACHILAYMFYDLHRNEGYDIIYTRPLGDYPGNHVYIYKDGWAFDTAGWTREEELLRVMREDYATRHPSWNIERIVITDMGLETFCKKYYHRSPAYYPHLPWGRAYKYIKNFSSKPPKKSKS